MSQKKAIDKTGANPEVLEKIQGIDKTQMSRARGIGGDPLYEPIPQFIKTSYDKIIENGNNASIVLTRDRNASRLSGYGGRGHTQAAAIDIVVGRMGHKVKSIDKNNRIWVDPSFKDDAARIYISQKSDIDDYFELPRGKIGNSRTKSAIALKADGVRIIAREGIKLVTKTDSMNSQGGAIDSIAGIDLIAGGDDSDLQPIVKGRNLSDAMKRMTHHVDKLAGIVDGLLMAQVSFNQALTHHFHFSPFFGLPTTPSPTVVSAGIKTMIDHLTQVKMSLVSFKVNLVMYKNQYFNPAGKNYVNSRWNNTN